MWDPIGVDRLVQRRVATTDDPLVELPDDFDELYWAVTERGSDVVEEVPEHAGVLFLEHRERFRYSAYGVPSRTPLGDFNNDDLINSDDLTLFASVMTLDHTSPAYLHAADYDLDGTISAKGDYAAHAAELGTSGFKGDYSTSGLIVGYAGAIWDPAVELWLMRHRWLDPHSGRWLTRDPAGYVDGMSLYGYVGQGVWAKVDPYGLNLIDWLEREADLWWTALTEDPAYVAQGFVEGAGTGLKATVNAAADTVVSFATLGYVDDVEVWAVTEEDLQNGYNAAYGFSRAGWETLVAAGGVTVITKAGKTVRLTVVAAEGAQSAAGLERATRSMAEEGLSLANSLEAAASALEGFAFFRGAGRALKRHARALRQKSQRQLDELTANSRSARSASQTCSVHPAAATPESRTWNQFQRKTAGRFASRAEAAEAWRAYKAANGIVTGTQRSKAVWRHFLKSMAEDYRTPKWMKQWLRNGKLPPGYEVDHLIALSAGGADAASNMRLLTIIGHRLRHKYYRPWE